MIGVITGDGMVESIASFERFTFFQKGKILLIYREGTPHGRFSERFDLGEKDAKLWGSWDNVSDGMSPVLDTTTAKRSAA